MSAAMAASAPAAVLQVAAGVPPAPLYETGAFGHEASLVVALLLGTAFGWFLERGGLGSARKLVGQFYGTDFAVFKVLFTAVVTAMLGLFWLSRAGLVDPYLVYVPRTYVLPQLAGGLVFGVGLVLGGLCPGTSCVAASSGRLDGLALIAGMLLGVLAFDEMYPALAAFMDSTFAGALTLPAWTGLPVGAVVFGVTCVALAGFALAERLEAKP
ncbi:MAG TPA: YeeE/YedE thiosulfate transporter family protein [Longimicrobiales bacterium]